MAHLGAHLIESADTYDMPVESQKYSVDIKLKENESDLNYLGKTSLSKGKQTAFLISLIMALQNLEQSPFLLFDEVGSNLDLANMDIFVQLLNELAKKTQIVVTSFSEKIFELEDLEIFEVQMMGESKMKSIDIDRAKEVIMNVQNDSNK